MYRSPAAIELARRVVRSRQWRWRAGMAVLSDDSDAAPTRILSVLNDQLDCGQQTLQSGDCLPDLRDEQTLLWTARITRDAASQPSLEARRAPLVDRGAGSWGVYQVTGDPEADDRAGRFGAGETPAEAWVDALERLGRG